MFVQVWRRLTSLLLPAPPRIVQGGFRPLDVESTATRLRLREKGRESGRRELPAADTTTLDGPQEEIVQEVRKHIATNLAREVAELAELGRRVQRAAEEDPAGRVRALGEDTLRAIESAKHDARLGLKRARAVTEEAEERLRRFRQEHALDRPAEYPRSRLLAVMLLVLLTTVESMLNVYFFAQGSDYGALGGVAISLVFAAVDLAICATTGRWATHLHHRSTFHKAAGAMAALVAVAWIPLWALTSGHLREALLRNPEAFDQAFSLARETFVAAPLGFDRLDTWALVSLGAILSVAGFLSGRRLDDPYPGYGSVARQAADAREEEEDAAEQLAQEIRRLAEKGRQAMREALSSYDAVIGGLAATVATATAKQKTVRLFVGQVSESTAALLKLYRNANLAARKTPPPAYFDRTDNLPGDALAEIPALVEPPPVEVLRARAAAAASAFAEMEQRIAGAAEEPGR